MMGYTTYEGKDSTTFLVTHQPTSKKVIVRTPLQEFYLFQDEWHQEENIEMMIYFIEKGYINDMQSLCNRLKGRFSLMPSNPNYDIETRNRKLKRMKKATA